jgi:hypothetical protein
VDVGEAADGDYGAALTEAQRVGSQLVHLSLDWSRVETGVRVYDPHLLDIANAFYPLTGVEVALTLRPINTVRTEFPADLQGRQCDDPEVISRFGEFLDLVAARLPNLQIRQVVVGNEIDIYLRDAAAYARYRTFFVAARSKVRTLWPGARVAVAVTFSGLTGPLAGEVASLNQEADYVAVNYYPLNADFTVRAPSTVHADFQAVVDRVPLLPIRFRECGYPSAPLCNSSEAQQAQFVREVFTAWDKHASRVEAVTFVWMHDASTQALDEWEVYYGLSAPAFRAYLSSLGMRHATGSGVDKPSWKALEAEALRRGW